MNNSFRETDKNVFLENSKFNEKTRCRHLVFSLIPANFWLLLIGTKTAYLFFLDMQKVDMKTESIQTFKQEAFKRIKTALH